MGRIVKLVTPENVGPHPKDGKVEREIIVVIRTNYSEELMAYFIRSKIGILLFVNEKLDAQTLAMVISLLERKINECGTTEVGVLKKGLQYFCGGTCCKNRFVI